jgi:hypothetical protein
LRVRIMISAAMSSGSARYISPCNRPCLQHCDGRVQGQWQSLRLIRHATGTFYLQCCNMVYDVSGERAELGLGIMVMVRD